MVISIIIYMCQHRPTLVSFPISIKLHLKTYLTRFLHVLYYLLLG
jgi:hypothetical protein